MRSQWTAGAASLRRLAANVGGLAGLVSRRAPATHVHLYDEHGEVRSLDPDREPGRAILACALELVEAAERLSDDRDRPSDGLDRTAK